MVIVLFFFLPSSFNMSKITDMEAMMNWTGLDWENVWTLVEGKNELELMNLYFFRSWIWFGIDKMELTPCLHTAPNHIIQFTTVVQDINIIVHTTILIQFHELLCQFSINLLCPDVTFYLVFISLNITYIKKYSTDVLLSNILSSYSLLTVLW